MRKKSKSLKRIISLVLAIVMMASIGTSVMAEDVDSCFGNQYGNYFEFGSKQRINSNGTFTFQFADELVSEHFKVSSSSSSLIRAKATSTKSNDTYYITLRDASTLEIVARVPYEADGTWHSHTFNGLSTSKEYEMVFRNDLLDWGTETVTGSGDIGNYVNV